MTTATQTLSRRLCPWLAPVLSQFDTAHRAGNLGHAWLISGPAGIGKVNLALVLARRLLGADDEPADLDAPSALAALSARHDPVGRHPDLHWLQAEEDKETISVEQVRDVVEACTLTAHSGGAKVVIVEPAEALTTAAANALLKTLEEPSAGSYLLLLSHQPGRLLATVRSRCQRFTLHPPPPETVAAWLDVQPSVVAEAARIVGTAPLQIASLIRTEGLSVFKRLEMDMLAVSEDRAEPQAVAQSWAKGDTEVAVSWLRRQLHLELRSRYAPADVSTGVTVAAGATLHNAWRNLPARTLFEQYDRAEKLLNQLGSGLNIELAVLAMLSALVVNRGRS